jgi:hypothetical protein
MGKNSNRGRGKIEIPEALIEYLEGEGTLTDPRAVAHYDRDEYIFSVSEDLQEKYTERELNAIIEDFRLQDVGQEQQEDLYNVGELYCSIRAFDDAILLHFISGETEGTVVSLPPEVAPKLTLFIDDILRILAEHAGQDVEELPSWAPEE